MACEIKLWWGIVLVMVVISKLEQRILGDPQVPCYFIFGDSLSDNGNNNNLSTLAKVNYPPYGIDFPLGPTGRFSNGATSVDFIAKLVGFDDYIPALATGASDILKGVNYASGSAGIRDETGQYLGARISLNEQLENHQVIINRIAANLGSKDSAAQYLNKCLYSVGMGTNDYINNYFLPQLYNTSKQFNPEQYAQVLIDQYSQQLMTLYHNGARKIALFGLGPIGCTPNAITSYPRNDTQCIENMNNAAQLFNNELKSLVDQLNSNLTDANFIYVNIYGMSLFDDVSTAGFKVLNTSCCPVTNIGSLCDPNKIPCPNRREYVFWDGFHPTEAANQITANRSYNAFDPFDAYPFDIGHLVQK